MVRSLPSDSRILHSAGNKVAFSGFRLIYLFIAFFSQDQRKFFSWTSRSMNREELYSDAIGKMLVVNEFVHRI